MGNQVIVRPAVSSYVICVALPASMLALFAITYDWEHLDASRTIALFVGIVAALALLVGWNQISMDGTVLVFRGWHGRARFQARLITVRVSCGPRPDGKFAGRNIHGYFLEVLRISDGSGLLQKNIKVFDAAELRALFACLVEAGVKVDVDEACRRALGL